ncbi:MAG: hypothetical protein HRT61_01035 [Ekhidna sp.]|nr:hypothetical protein [Ekhidna sp.]
MTDYPHVYTGIYIEKDDGEGRMELPCSRFPYGELHVTVPEKFEHGEVELTVIWDGPETLEALLLASNALAYMDNTINNITIPYMPYSRQDRVVHKGEAFSIQTFGSLLKGIHVNHDIVTFDLHSVACQQCLPESIRNVQLSSQRLFDWQDNYDFFVFPDKGAVSRYSDIVDDERYLAYNKTRDEHGSIDLELDSSRSTIHNKLSNIPNPRILVVDDLCDGGGTFVELRHQLSYIIDPEQVDLYVTHMRTMSKDIWHNYAKVMSSNSFLHDDSKPLTATIEWSEYNVS